MSLLLAGPRRVVAAGLGFVFLLASVAGAAPGTEVVASGERPLRSLAAQATATVLSDVVRTESYDQDRLQVHRLHVVRVLAGRIDAAEPGVVDMRTGTKRPPLLADGERVVALLRPATPLSYLKQQLPAGDYFEVIGGRDGVVPVASDAEAQAVERALAAGAAVANDDPAAVRRLAFTELASGSPRLAADALAELRGLGRLAPLSPEEVQVLGRALRDRRIEPAVRIGLLRLFAGQRAVEAAPALAGVEADTPAVLEALLEARAELGVSNRAQLGPQLTSTDPAVRAAAVRALARLDEPGALDELGRYATSDPDLGVRTAAIEGLGASKRAAAVPVLAQTFDSEDKNIRQKSARAMLAIGGPAADDALVQLALHGRLPETRRYATLALVVAHGRDHSTIRRIESSNPPPEVRDLLEKGLERPD